MPIKELIIDDLQRFANDPTLVASEEAMRFMMHHYHKEGMLSNPKIVPFDDLPNQLRHIHADRGPSHSQFFIEFNTRSLSSRAVPFNHNTITGESISVHYGAMDVFCDENGTISAFIADHYFGTRYRYHGDHGFLQKFNFPIYFIVAGGSYYQTDSTHCPIFTLQHLLLTAHDTALHQTIKDRSRDIQASWNHTLVHGVPACIEANKIYIEVSEKSLKYALIHWFDHSKIEKTVKLRLLKLTFEQAVSMSELLTSSLLAHLAGKGYLPRTAALPWFDLEPKYNVYTQSFSVLTEKYPQFLRKKHAILCDDMAIPVLESAKFDELVGPHIVCEIDKRGTDKAMNKGIEFLTKALSSVALDNISSYSEDQLIDLCYGERYPLVARYLKSVLEKKAELTAQEPSNTNIAFNTTKLFSFIFSNQFMLNCFGVTSVTPFVSFIQKPSIIELELLSFMDIEALFYNVTFVRTDARTFNQKMLTVMMNNHAICLDILEKKSRDSTYTIESIHMIELLLNPHSAPLFLIERVKQLYLSGMIQHEHLRLIKLHQVKPIQEVGLSLAEDATLLALFTPQESPASVACFSESPPLHTPTFFHNQTVERSQKDLSDRSPSLTK